MNPYCLAELDALVPDKEWSIGQCVEIACLLEASAVKAGNVHPGANFVDMDYQDFRDSASAVGEVFDELQVTSIGNLVLKAVEATQRRVGKNTKLGMILLLGPLVLTLRGICLRDRCPPSSKLDVGDWQSLLDQTLAAMTAEDTRQVYEAIRRARPGGLGKSKSMDVDDTPPKDLMAAMRSAAHRDDIAKQYTSRFEDVFELSRSLDLMRNEGIGWLEAISRVHILRLACYPDSLILRKTNATVSDYVMQLARQVEHAMAAITPTSSLTQLSEWQALDRYLRSDGHRRNPGTTADLLAGAIFVSLNTRLFASRPSQ